MASDDPAGDNVVADTSDVETTLVNLVGGILYPGGATAVGLPLRIYRGFPAAEQLDVDLAAGAAHVTVYSAPGFSRLSGGYLEDGKTTPGVTTITATVSGASVTIGGTVGAGQLVGVLVDGAAYAYACLATDTPSTVATTLAAIVGGGPIAAGFSNPIAGITLDPYPTVSGPTVTFATNRPIAARVGSIGSSLNLIRYQTQAFRITVWAPTPASRDATISLLDANLSATRFLALPDGQSARLTWHNTSSDDVPQREQMWKRDLLYTVQFATSLNKAAAQMLFGVINLTAQNTGGLSISTPVQVVG